MSALTLASCSNGKVYDNYRSTDIDGWNKGDTIDFNAGKLPEGSYEVCVGFRASEQYPYKELGLNVGWTVYPSNRYYRKTIKCNVFDDSGHMTGTSSVSTNDYLFSVTTITVNRGDSVVFSVGHAMNQDILPGLTAVGLQLIPIDK